MTQVTTGTGARSFEVELPIGVGVDGHRRRDATVQKMRGYEEALLADPQLDGVHLATALLVACTVQLAGMPRPGPDLIDDLYVADREYLLLELRRVSYGDDLRTAYRCPHCGAEAVVVENLALLGVDRLAPETPLPDLRVELEDGYEDHAGRRHTSVRLRLPRGSDEAFVTLALPNGRAQAQDALMLRCIESFGSLTRGDIEAYGGTLLRELTVGDRRRLVSRLRDGVPGVRWLREVTCPGCGLGSTHTLDVSDFFPVG